MDSIHIFWNASVIATRKDIVIWILPLKLGKCCNHKFRWQWNDELPNKDERPLKTEQVFSEIFWMELFEWRTFFAWATDTLCLTFLSVVFSSISCSISKPFLRTMWKEVNFNFYGGKKYFSSLQQIELLYLFLSARNHDNLDSEFMELDLENNLVLELLAVESTGRTQFYPICSLISSSKI